MPTPYPSPKPFTPEEIALVRTVTNYAELLAVATQLGRSPQTIRNRLIREGVKFGPNWEAMAPRIRRYLKQGMSKREIARRLKVSVHGLIMNLGVIEEKPRNPAATPAGRKGKAASAVASNVDDDELAERIAAAKLAKEGDAEGFGDRFEEAMQRIRDERRIA